MLLENSQPGNFPPAFQWQVVKLMLHDATFLRQVQPHLPIAFFSSDNGGEYLIRAAELVYNYLGGFGQRNPAPTKTIFDTLCSEYISKLDAQWKKPYADAFISLSYFFYDQPWQGSEIEFVRNRTIEWIKQRGEMSLLIDAKRAIDQGKSLADIRLVERAKEISLIGMHANSLGLDLFSDINQTWVDLQQRELRSVLSSGNNLLDRYLSGGHGRKELVTYLAPPNVGKTTWMCDLTSKFSVKGRVGAYITCEQADVLIRQKIMSGITGLTPDHWFDTPENQGRLWQWLTYIAQQQSKCAVVQFPTGRVTTREVEAYLINLQAHWGRKLDYCVVDYADLLRPGTTRHERRFELAEIYTDLRAIAVEMDLAMITASQSNRGSVGQERVGMEDLAEAFDKAGISDVIISLCQTEEELRANQIRLFFAKNRIGQKFAEVPMTVNYAIAKLVEDERRIGMDRAFQQATQNMNAMQVLYGQQQNVVPAA